MKLYNKDKENKILSNISSCAIIIGIGYIIIRISILISITIAIIFNIAIISISIITYLSNIYMPIYNKNNNKLIYMNKLKIQ